jgi:hypothetical protein
MKAEQPRPIGRDRDTQTGIVKALAGALGKPLLLDQAADAAFASSIRALRGVPGTNKGGEQ